MNRKKGSGAISLFIASGALAAVSTILFIKPVRFFSPGGTGIHGRQFTTSHYEPDITKGFAVVLMAIALVALLVGIRIYRDRDS